MIHVNRQAVSIPPFELKGLLEMPEHAKGLVIFAHGSGSGRYSERNQYVAQTLLQRGFATLLFDLLSEAEAGERGKVFDIELLAQRLVMVNHWLQDQEGLASLPRGLFGASTGAAAAIVAAAQEPRAIFALVARGGRVDLAGPALEKLQTPTLLIVGEKDELVLELNEQAMQYMACTCELVIIPRAGHLFQEAGALEKVAEIAGNWFVEQWSNFKWTQDIKNKQESA